MSRQLKAVKKLSFTAAANQNWVGEEQLCTVLFPFIAAKESIFDSMHTKIGHDQFSAFAATRSDR